MIAGGLNPALSGTVAAGPMPTTGGDLSDIPPAQLSQFAQQSGNPALKAAAIQEIARRKASPTGWHDMAAAGQPGLTAVSTGQAKMPGQLPPVVPSDQTHPAMDALATGVTAADAAAQRIPSYVDQKVPSSGAARNPAIAAVEAAAPRAGNAGAAGNIGDLAPEDLTPRDKWLALAKGFGAMAASRQPGLLGALGEGAGVAADALREDTDQAMRQRVLNVESRQRQQGLDETARANLAREGQGADQLAISREQLAQAQQQFEFEKQKYQQGVGNETALKLAQIEAERAQRQYYLAQAAATSASAGSLVQTDQGLGQISGSKFTPVMGPNGQPVNQQYKPTAVTSKQQMLVDAGIPPQEAALIAAGQKAPTPTQIENAASVSAKNAAAGYYGAEAQRVYDEVYNRVKAELSGAAAPAAPPAAMGTPGAGAPPQGALYTPGSTIVIDGKKYKVRADGRSAEPIP